MTNMLSWYYLLNSLCFPPLICMPSLSLTKFACIHGSLFYSFGLFFYFIDLNPKLLVVLAFHQSSFLKEKSRVFLKKIFWLFMALCSFIWIVDLTCHDLKILLLFALKIENINQYTYWMNRFGKNWYLYDKVYSYLWWWCISLFFISFNVILRGQ